MSELTYPAELRIEPLAEAVQATVTVPGSKSITNRALVLAALAGEHSCVLEGALQSEDTAVMLESLRRLGVDVEADILAQMPFRPRVGEVKPMPLQVFH